MLAGYSRLFGALKKHLQVPMSSKSIQGQPCESIATLCQMRAATLLRCAASQRLLKRRV